MLKQPNKTEYATKSDLKGLRKDINQDIKTHMGVLYEKFSDDVKVLAESHLDTSREVKKLGRKVDILGGRMGNLEGKVEFLGEKVEGFDGKVGGLEGKVDMLIDTVGEIKVDVAEIKEGLKNKADLKDQKLLEKRVAALEVAA